MAARIRRTNSMHSQENGIRSNNESFPIPTTESSGSLRLRGDWGNIVLLTFLYVLQGIPLGLAGAIPMILQNRHVTYKQQAIFSFVHWPFSLKLLWAPLVDSLYSSRMGRRKSWLIPTQYLIGIFMLIMSFSAKNLLGGDDSSEVNVIMITVVFFALCFLAATQDIAVDGWALTMLKRQNVAYASTCNCIGQTAGYFIGFIIFLALESADFCNKYLRSEPKPDGLITLPDFLYFWGIVYLVSTSLVWIFKTERVDGEQTQDDDHDIIKSFRNLLRIIQLPMMRLFILFLLTMKIGFAATDAITGLKLSEGGVPKDKLALLAIPMIPLQIILPLIISHYTAGPRPLNILIKAYPFRLAFAPVFAFLVWWTPSVKIAEGAFPYYYYSIVLLVYALHQITLYTMFVSVMAFFAKISDPTIGGTYMTLLNTLSNLGGNWPVTVSLWLVDPLTSKTCHLGKDGAVKSCDNDEDIKACTSDGGHCETYKDGYYVLIAFGMMVGLLWLFWGRKQVVRLQSARINEWRVPPSRS